MRALALLVQAIGSLNRLVGQIFSWLAVGVVVVCFVVVVQRYVFHTTFLWMQDLYVWLSGPFMFVVFNWGLPYVQRSWSYHEASQNIGGMPGLFVLKTFILAFAVLVGLQGIAMIARSILVLSGKEELLAPAYRYPVDAEEELPSV